MKHPETLSNSLYAPPQWASTNDQHRYTLRRDHQDRWGPFFERNFKERSAILHGQEMNGWQKTPIVSPFANLEDAAHYVDALVNRNTANGYTYDA
jgi:hypothetical protein